MKKLLPLLLILFAYINPAMAGKNILYLNSEEGDYIGQGQQWVFTDSDLNFDVTELAYSRMLRFNIDNIGEPGTPPFTSWTLRLGHTGGFGIPVGFYGNAGRFLTGTNPQLDFSGMHRGCNWTFGRFEVKEAVYTSNWDVISFAVDFVQHCSRNDNAPPLYGYLRFNSDVPIPILIDPRISIDNGVNAESCVEATGPDGVTIELTAESVQEDPINPYIYEWSLPTGNLWNGREFTFDLGLDSEIEATVTITDPTSGESASKTQSICVSDTTAPEITILSPKSGELIMGKYGRQHLKVQIEDIVDVDLDTYELFLGIERTVNFDTQTGVSMERFYRPSPGGEPQTNTIVVKTKDASGNEAEASVEVIVESRAKRRRNSSRSGDLGEQY